MSSTEKRSLITWIVHLWDPQHLRAWAHPYHARKGWRAFAVRQLEVFVLTARSIQQEEITLRAAALTYSTLLSLVPLLAVAFALFKAFGGLQKLEGPLRQLVMENLAVGRAAEVGQWLDQFIAKINAGAIAGVGVLVLFYSAVTLLTNIESSFNRIWGIQRSRPLLARFFTYWGLITLAPPLVGLSVSITARLESSAFAMAVVTWLPWGLGRWLIALLSMLSTCTAFVLSYLIVPNTKVRLQAGLLGGVVAGLLWNLSKVLFISVSAGSLKYSAVYGALGVLPLLMLWMYLSWIIVLFGATYAYANQSVYTEGLEFAAMQMSHGFKELLGARLLVAVVESFSAGRAAPTAEELAAAVGTMPSLARRVLSVLVSQGLLAEVRRKSEEAAYLPCRPLEQLSLARLREVLRHGDGDVFKLNQDATYQQLVRIFEAAERAGAQVLEPVKARQLCASPAAPDSTPALPALPQVAAPERLDSP